MYIESNHEICGSTQPSCIILYISRRYYHRLCGYADETEQNTESDAYMGQTGTGITLKLQGCFCELD